MGQQPAVTYAQAPQAVTYAAPQLGEQPMQPQVYAAPQPAVAVQQQPAVTYAQAPQAVTSASPLAQVIEMQPAPVVTYAAPQQLVQQPVTYASPMAQVVP